MPPASREDPFDKPLGLEIKVLASAADTCQWCQDEISRTWLHPKTLLMTIFCVGRPCWCKIVIMNERPFPKPPSADPLPLETWLDQTDRSEVGREPFFRGRDTEFSVFRRAVGSLHDGRTGGGTMVFQGAPGAGKSALMAECMEAVRRHSTPEDPWVAVAIQPDSLQSPVDVVEVLVAAANAERGRLGNIASGTSVIRALDNVAGLARKLCRGLSARGGGAFGVSVGGHRDEGVTAVRAFRNAAPLLGRFRCVICVDEAQNIPVSDRTRGVMGCLHDPPGKLPLVAAFFGLSDTQQVLRECGLSRFARGRVVTLDTLPSDDSACAIRSVFDAYGFTGAPEDREVWVNRLAELSQGWPQHVNSVAVAACGIIRANGGRIDSGHLDAAMAAAEEYKQEYYAGRLAAGTEDSGIYKRIALVAGSSPDGILSRATLRDLVRSAPENASGDFSEFLANALHAGLLAPTQGLPDHYRIPIPSFGDWLRALPVEPTRG